MGFIAGTFVFALLSISDRYSPSLVFFLCAILASLSNLGLGFQNQAMSSLLAWRFATGFFLAGIYPVGMKIAADYFDKSLGKSLGLLVGALVVGTALPHFIKFGFHTLSWQFVVYTTSALAFFGGLLVFIFLPDGPYRKKNGTIKLSSAVLVFREKNFRAVAFGYFGHMWELYTFWAFVPSMLSFFNNQHSAVNLSVPLWSFLIIAIGALACIVGASLSQRLGEKKIATIALIASGVCCLVSPLFLSTNSAVFFITFLFFWGAVVIADSPLFSTLVARHAPAEIKGTALTFVTCIGFSITIVSLQMLQLLSQWIAPQYLYIFLTFGPAWGAYSLITSPNDKKKTDSL